MLLLLLAAGAVCLVQAAPKQYALGQNENGSEELVLQFALRVQNTPTGARLTLNIEENPDNNGMRGKTQPLFSVVREIPRWPTSSMFAPPITTIETNLPSSALDMRTKSQDSPEKKLLDPDLSNKKVKLSESPLATALITVLERKDHSKPDDKILTTKKPPTSTMPPDDGDDDSKMGFKISLGGGGGNPNRRPVPSPTRKVSSNPSGTKKVVKEENETNADKGVEKHTTAKNDKTTTARPSTPNDSEELDELLDGVWDVNKAVADQGFGVLQSRCASFAPDLVSDGAGGCTRVTSRNKKKNGSLGLTYRSAPANALPDEVKSVSVGVNPQHAEVINLSTS